MPSNHPDSINDPTKQTDVLIIAAASTMRDDLAGRLRAAGLEVDAVDSAEAALTLTERSAPKVVMIDPDGLDGCTLAQELKRGDETRFVPIVMTAHVEIRAKAYQCGVDDFRLKPVDVDDLALRLQALVRSRVLLRSLRDERREIQGEYDTHRRSEMQYRGIFDALPMPAIVIDASTLAVVMANAAAARLTGYDPETLVGLTASQLSPGEAGNEWLAQLCSTGDTTQTSTGTIVGADGRRVAVEAGVGRVEDLDKSVVVMLLTDLRLRNEADQERIDGERANMLRETAIAVNSRINDPLFVILNDIGSLQAGLKSAEGSIQSRLSRVLEAAHRIQRVTAQLSTINKVVTKEYLPGVRMLDLDESVSASAEQSTEEENEQ